MRRAGRARPPPASPSTSRARASTRPTTGRRRARARRAATAARSRRRRLGLEELRLEGSDSSSKKTPSPRASRRTSSARRSQQLATAPNSAGNRRVGGFAQQLLGRLRRTPPARSTRLPAAVVRDGVEHVGVAAAAGRRRRSRAAASSARPCRDERLRRVPADDRALDEVDGRRVMLVSWPLIPSMISCWNFARSRSVPVNSPLAAGVLARARQRDRLEAVEVVLALVELQVEGAARRCSSRRLSGRSTLTPPIASMNLRKPSKSTIATWSMSMPEEAPRPS